MITEEMKSAWKKASELALDAESAKRSSDTAQQDYRPVLYHLLHDIRWHSLRGVYRHNDWIPESVSQKVVIELMKLGYPAAVRNVAYGEAYIQISWDKPTKFPEEMFGIQA